MTSNSELENSALHRDLAFPYRVYGDPKNACSQVLVLLHGSGVDETTLVPLAAEIAPRAALIAVRGRVPQEGGWRWFQRITPTRFEQASIRAEANAFADFLPTLAKVHGFDLHGAVFLGYSNGANLITSTMLLHPGLVGRALLLRAMPVLDEVPTTDLSKVRMLVIAGAMDVTYGPFAPALVALLRSHGADVEDQTVAAGHEFGPEDAWLARKWLSTPPKVVADAGGNG